MARAPIAWRVEGRIDDVGTVLKALDEAARQHGVFLQLVDVAAVYDSAHVASAHFHAERAQRQRVGSAKTLGADFLRYLTGEHQVRRAIEQAGVGVGTGPRILVAAGPRASVAASLLIRRLGWRVASRRLRPNAKALERLAIPRRLVKSTPPARRSNLVLERVALLDLEIAQPDV